MRSCIVTMEEILANIIENVCVKLLPKIHDLTEKFTCQYMTQAGNLLTAMYHKINSPTGQFHSNYHSYSPFSMWEVQMKRVTSVHAKPITISVRYCSVQLTRYPIAGNKFLPSMTCPDKYFLSPSCRQITTDLSPDFDFPCTKHEYNALAITHHYTEP